MRIEVKLVRDDGTVLIRQVQHLSDSLPLIGRDFFHHPIVGEDGSVLQGWDVNLNWKVGR